MESMHPDIEFRQSNRSADFIKGLSEEESDDRFINHGQLLHTLFSAIETKDDIEPAIHHLIFEGIIGSKEAEERIRSLTVKAFSCLKYKSGTPVNGDCSTSAQSFTKTKVYYKPVALIV